MESDILVTNSGHRDFHTLIKLLDADLNARYGDLQKEYDNFNKVDFINDVVIVYRNQAPAACGAFKVYSRDTVELKRIFVAGEYRRQGLAKLIVAKLEELATAKGYRYAILETGDKQIEAINLYQHLGYNVIPNYEPYTDYPASICMKKDLRFR